MLKPCGSAVARLVDQEGEPATDSTEVSVFMVVRPGVDRFNSKMSRAGMVVADSDFIANVDRVNYPNGFTDTDAAGRITLPALVPGATYRIFTTQDGKSTVAKEFVAQAGEAIDLGDLVVDAEGE